VNPDEETISPRDALHADTTNNRAFVQVVARRFFMCARMEAGPTDTVPIAFVGYVVTPQWRAISVPQKGIRIWLQRCVKAG
jgi:hypothetical protein